MVGVLYIMLTDVNVSMSVSTNVVPENIGQISVDVSVDAGTIRAERMVLGLSTLPLSGNSELISTTVHPES